MKTRVTELLGIEYPIIQGGMAWVATHELASAVSNAGGLGIIGAGGAPASWVREQIQAAKKETDKPFGVNLMLMNPEAHTDRNPALFCHIHNRFYTLTTSNVSGIDTNFIRTVLHGCNRKPVIKMDIRNQRDGNLFFDFRQRRSCLLGGNRAADNFTTDFCQLLNLCHRCRNILCLCICHRLNRNRMISSNPSVSNLYFLCDMSLHHNASSLLDK